MNPNYILLLTLEVNVTVIELEATEQLRGAKNKSVQETEPITPILDGNCTNKCEEEGRRGICLTLIV